MPRPKGYKLSEETKEKISKSHKGLRHTEESKKKMSETRKGSVPPNKGKKASDETRKRMSISAIIRCSDPEYIKLMSERSKKKWEDTEYKTWYIDNLSKLREEHPEWKIKSIESRKNSGYVVSEETKEKMSKSHKKNSRKGIPVSIETRKKISDTMKGRIGPNKGKILSDEWKKNLSSSHKGILLGKNNPNWNGGSSFEPYCPKFNDDFKEYIRNKFNRICFICGKTEQENGSRLSIHHVDYNKMDICNGKSWSFIPVCKYHNTKFNTNRWHWFNLLVNYWINEDDKHLNRNMEVDL